MKSGADHDPGNTVPQQGGNVLDTGNSTADGELGRWKRVLDFRDQFRVVEASPGAHARGLQQ